MAGLATAALAFCVLATAAHLISVMLTLARVQARKKNNHSTTTPVTIIRPVCGSDHFDELTLRSTFEIRAASYEIIFCAARESDPAVPLVRKLIDGHPHVSAKLLVGDDRPTSNPKLNNVVKGWKAARHPWIVLADNNVLMSPSYLDDLFAAFEPGVGLVCSPPIGSRPAGFWAELECAFLNTYQARWQSSAAATGFGFAQGKSMLWRRDILDEAGGIEALGGEIAEDAAATKIVRARGLHVALVNRPFEQPLGPRTFRQVWDRQVRWARLRRATFRLVYAPEILAGSVLPILAGAFAAPGFDIAPAFVLSVLAAVWFGSEAALAWVAGWHMSMLSPLSWMLRDLLLPALWLEGWAGNTFVWRGNDMSVTESGKVSDGISARRAVAITGDAN
jgi:ceramide glucosyltransferase